MRTLGFFAVLLVATAARGQVGACKPGVDCTSNSFNTPASTGFGSLPKRPDAGCANPGRLKYAADAGWAQCVSGPWSLLESSSSGVDSCTGTSCSIGQGGIRVDAGITVTGGNNITSFSWTADFNGCLWAGLGSQMYSSCIIRSNTGLALDGTGALWTMDNAGTSDFNGSVGVQAVRMLATGGHFLGNAAATSYFEANGTHGGGVSATVPAAVLRATQALTAGDAVGAIQQSDGTNLLRCFQGGGCSVGSSAVQTVATTPAVIWSTLCISCTTDTNFIMPLANWTNVTQAARIECAWETAGTGGTTNASLQLWDVTAAASVGTCAIGACNTAAKTPMGCTFSAGGLTAGHVYTTRLSSKGDCAVAPQGIGCTTPLTP